MAIDLLRIRPLSGGRPGDEVWFAYRDGGELRVLNADHEPVAIIRNSTASQRIFPPGYSEEYKHPTVVLDTGNPRRFANDGAFVKLMREFMLESQLRTRETDSGREASEGTLALLSGLVTAAIAAFIAVSMADGGGVNRWKIKGLIATVVTAGVLLATGARRLRDSRTMHNMLK